jgi:hypothetical protein
MIPKNDSERAESLEAAEQVFASIDTFIGQLRRALDEPTEARAILAVLKGAADFVDTFDDAKRDQLSCPFKLAATAVVNGSLLQATLANLSEVAKQYEKAEALHGDLTPYIGSQLLAVLSMLEVAGYREISKPLQHLNTALLDVAEGRRNVLFEPRGPVGNPGNSNAEQTLQRCGAASVAYLVEGLRYPLNKASQTVARILHDEGFVPSDLSICERTKASGREKPIDGRMVERWYQKGLRPNPKSPQELEIASSIATMRLRVNERGHPASPAEAEAKVRTVSAGAKIPQ